MKHLLVFVLFLAGTASAEDKTPYKFLFMGNGYTGPRNVSVSWLAERYDVGMCGMGDWPNLLDSIYDVCRANGKEFKWGPYASSQQINMYIAGGSSVPYSERITDTVSHWQYIYATHYLDSIGVSPESLVVHVADDMWAQTQQWDGYRRIVTTDLPYHKRRWTYQHWNNVPGDYFYPAGYAWLANGYNENTQRAIAYAYRRHFIEDSARVGHGKGHWTAYFMDNQYRNSGTLDAYYSIDSTRGGPTSNQMDWVEQPAIETDDIALYYFDNSTLKIDSVIMAVLDSACDASGIDRIFGFANINKFSYSHLLAVLPSLRGVFLERPTGLTRSWPYENGWESWYKMADIMAENRDKYIAWYFGAESFCSSNPSDWNYDSSRIYLFHHAFFLQVRDTNAYVCPARFNDSTRWRDIYELDFGEPDSAAWEISNNGYPNTSYDKIAVMGRTYDDGNVFTLVRTTSGSADFVRDSVAVNLHALYREIDADADTSLAADSIFYMKPFMGKILILDNNPSPLLSDMRLSGGLCIIDSTNTISFTITDEVGLDSLRVWLKRPSDDTLLLNLAFPSGVTGYTGEIEYTWREEDCGLNDIAIYARDNEGYTLYLPEAMEIVVLDEIIDIGSAIRLIRYIFGYDYPQEPPIPADANCDGRIDLADPLYIINYVFRNGPPICCPP